MLDITDLNPTGPRLWRTLHKEELPGRAVGIALHYHFPVLQMRQESGGDVDVVLNQVPLGDSSLRPKQLLQVCEFDKFSIPLDFIVTSVFGDFYLCRRGLPGLATAGGALNCGWVIVTSGTL